MSAKLFSIRNINVDEIHEYINPSLKDHTPDPSILKDMNIAIERVVDGIRKKEKIAVLEIMMLMAQLHVLF